MKSSSILSPTSIERINFRSDIHGLRGLAVISVVFYHSNFEFLKGGWLGVDIFFLISGYLISNIIIAELNSGKFSFRAFYKRRIRRILPALLSTLTITSVFSYWLLTPKSLIEYSEAMISSIFFYSNYYFQNLDFYNTDPAKFNPLLHIWTLSVEEQFYLVFPLILFVIYKYFKKGLFIFVSSIFLVSILLNSTTQEISKFYQIEFRMWEFLLGTILVFFNLKRKYNFLNYFGMMTVVFSLVYYEDSTLNLNSVEPKITALTGVVLMIISEGSKITSLLENKYLAFLGTLSYSLYLLHQPFFALARVFVKKYNFTLDNLDYLILILLLIFIANLNFKFVESYFLASKNFSTLLLFSSTSIILLVTFSVFSFNTDGYKGRYDSMPSSILFYSTNTNLYPSDQDYELFNNFECDGSPKDKEALIFVGDSQLNTLSVDILQNYKNLSCHYTVSFITNPKGRCLLSKQNDTGKLNVCTDEFFKNFILDLNTQKAIVVVIGRFDTWLDPKKGGTEVQCDNCDFIDVVKTRFSAIADNSSKLIIIEPIPTYQKNIVESYLYKRVSWGESITIDYKEWKEEREQTIVFINSLKSNTIQRIDTAVLFCNTFEINKCNASSKKELLYTDGNHLTLEGTKILSEKIYSLLSKNSSN
jgi:peptidoglycan/LPS O-acetylase OafA/YrhL